MCSMTDVCFLCTKDYNCVSVDDRIVTQIKYVLPEITIIKLGIPLRICTVCDGVLCYFSKFKQSSVESSRRVEARIKGAQGPPVVDDNEASAAKPEMTEQTSMEEQLHTYTNPGIKETSGAKPSLLNPFVLLETISPNNQLHTQHTNPDNQEVWEGSSTESDEETVQKTHGIGARNIQTDDLKKKIQKKKVHRCNVCTELFVCKALLVRHMKKNHWRIKVLPCTVCKKIFINQFDLNKHMDLHNGIKNFPCSICKKRFFNKRYLKQHIILHTERKEYKTHARVQIIDSVSNKKLKYKNIIPQHTKTHSGIKTLQCKICDKLFKWKSYLIRHMISHSGKKAFRCDICDKSYTRKCTLTTHMKLHSARKDFRCEICDKLFTMKSYLTNHMKIHSRVTK